jgi:hypothetical protein
MKKTVSHVYQWFKDRNIERKARKEFVNQKKRFTRLFNFHQQSEKLYDKIKRAIFNAFEIGSNLTELGTGKEVIVESFDTDSLYLRVIEVKTGLRRTLDYKMTMEWNTFYFKKAGRI